MERNDYSMNNQQRDYLRNKMLYGNEIFPNNILFIIFVGWGWQLSFKKNSNSIMTNLKREIKSVASGVSPLNGKWYLKSKISNNECVS